MTGEPWERKPCTSSGPLPPTHTVAEKFSRSREFLPGVRLVLMPQDGSGTRSGRAAVGGWARLGTFLGSDASGRPFTCPRRSAGPQQPTPGTTRTVTFAVAWAALMCSSRRYRLLPDHGTGEG